MIMATRSSGQDMTVQWYVDYNIHQCVMDCEKALGAFCGGIAEPFEEKWLVSTPEECCESKLWWLKKIDCVPNYIW